jgi:membrane protease YdiL (CAAX protease family)
VAAEWPEGAVVEPNQGQVETPFSPAPTHPRALWSLRDLFLFVIFTVAAMVGANLLALGGYALLRSLLGWETASHRLYNDTFFLVSLQTIFHGLVLAYIVLLVVVNYRQPFWEALRWRPLSPRAAWNSLAGGVLLALVVVAFPPILPHTQDYPLQRLFSSPQAAYTIGAFAIFIAPFMEELIFRGVLFRFFEERVGLGFAVAATAVLFAGLHISEYWGAWNHVLLIFVVGIVFSLARGLTGSVAPSFVLHLAYNATLMLMLYVGTQQFHNVGSALFG